MIIILGGTGLLGKELSKNKNTLSIGSEYDLYDFTSLEKFLDKNKPKIIINCAAIKSEKVDELPINAINLNIIGNANISKYCILNKIRLVFISTDYVYPGDVGNYIETDNLNPQNNYAWTKLAGESSTKLVENHLIIRTSFGDNIFPYEYAYDNLYTSKDYVDIIAPMIFKVSVSDFIGTINVGTDRKTILEYANKRNNVKSKSLAVAKDFSLNIEKMMNLYVK